jgi:ketosteroid isomerase-like protein
MLAEDATWWAPGFGVMGKAQFAEMLSYIDRILKGSMKLTFKRITAEDDRVAVEAESDADLVNGKHYHNTYHILVVIHGGKIREIKEYHDTKYATEVLGDLLPNM